MMETDRGESLANPLPPLHSTGISIARSLISEREGMDGQSGFTLMDIRTRQFRGRE